MTTLTRVGRPEFEMTTTPYGSHKFTVHIYAVYEWAGDDVDEATDIVLRRDALPQAIEIAGRTGGGEDSRPPRVDVAGCSATVVALEVGEGDG